MSLRRWYEKLYSRLLLAALALLVFLAFQLGSALKKEQTSVLLRASLPGKEITAELLAQMEELPGFQKRWALFERECEIGVNRYSAKITITGVDFSEYPLTALASAGEKAAGSTPLLAVGEGFFAGLSDENGEMISERQAKALAKTYEDLQTTLKTEAAQTPGNAETPEIYAAGKAAGEPAQLFAIVKEEGVYMDAALMQRWMRGRGEQARVSGVLLELKGESSAAKAKEIMEKAGFSVERRLPGESCLIAICKI